MPQRRSAWSGAGARTVERGFNIGPHNKPDVRRQRLRKIEKSAWTNRSTMNTRSDDFGELAGLVDVAGQSSGSPGPF